MAQIPTGKLLSLATPLDPLQMHLSDLEWSTGKLSWGHSARVVDHWRHWRCIEFDRNLTACLGTGTTWRQLYLAYLRWSKGASQHNSGLLSWGLSERWWYTETQQCAWAPWPREALPSVPCHPQLKLKVGKMNYSLGNLAQMFSRSREKFIWLTQWHTLSKRLRVLHIPVAVDKRTLCNSKCLQT